MSKASKECVADGAVKETVTSLGSTFGTFAHRIQRKLREQEIIDGASQRAGDERQARMLQAMTTIRRALQDTCKINLGDRFEFDLEVNDWEGWPRLELNLIDSLQPDDRRFGLIVSAHDRNELGTIQLVTRAEAVLARIYLRDAQEMQRIPLLLKKAVRQFLDDVAQYVLNPVRQDQLLEFQTKPLEVADLDTHTEKLQSADVFSEDLVTHNDNIIRDDPEAQPLDSAAIAIK